MELRVNIGTGNAELTFANSGNVAIITNAECNTCCLDLPDGVIERVRLQDPIRMPAAIQEQLAFTLEKIAASRFHRCI